MSILNAIAQGTNPGAGMVQGRKNQLAMEDRDRSYNMAKTNQNRLAENDAFNRQWKMDERDYNRKQNTLQSKAKAREDAAEYVLEVRKQAMKLPPEARPGLVQNMWSMAGDLGVELPELTPKHLEAFQSLPLDDDGLSNYAAKQKVRIGLEQEAENKERERRMTAPTVVEQAADRKATAQAKTAELKVQDAEAQKDAASATKAELQNLASEFLVPKGDGTFDVKDSIKSVYGAWDGLTPTLMPGSVDAEAQIDRLVDLLTLENTKKMTGVLSESDIKILQRAGSILGNKRISQEVAQKELERIAGVLNKANIQDLVDKYAD
jgi:hypothetical protein